ncbi:hypothetical protein T492DRAFT_850403 [Pavlovales sp. CCMP2436]|nr:hypothetical protein T492DRAFT_850403 [Pavlovales sp. CCMP2436]
MDGSEGDGRATRKRAESDLEDGLGGVGRKRQTPAVNARLKLHLPPAPSTPLGLLEPLGSSDAGDSGSDFSENDSEFNESESDSDDHGDDLAMDADAEGRVADQEPFKNKPLLRAWLKVHGHNVHAVATDEEACGNALDKAMKSVAHFEVRLCLGRHHAELFDAETILYVDEIAQEELGKSYKMTDPALKLQALKDWDLNQPVERKLKRKLKYDDDDVFVSLDPPWKESAAYSFANYIKKKRVSGHNPFSDEESWCWLENFFKRRCILDGVSGQPASSGKKEEADRPWKRKDFRREAIISKDHRYVTTRAWGAHSDLIAKRARDQITQPDDVVLRGLVTCKVIGLSPGTIDAENFDGPYGRRLADFADHMGYSGVVLLNAYALVRLPKEKCASYLKRVKAAGDTQNDHVLRRELAAVSSAVCAWGRNLPPERARAILRIFDEENCRPLRPKTPLTPQGRRDLKPGPAGKPSFLRQS